MKVDTGMTGYSTNNVGKINHTSWTSAGYLGLFEGTVDFRTADGRVLEKVKLLSLLEASPGKYPRSREWHRDKPGPTELLKLLRGLKVRWCQKQEMFINLGKVMFGLLGD